MTRVAGSRVFVAGGTGVLGRVLVPALVARGHEVVGLARTPVAARSLRILGATPVEASLFDLVGLVRAVDGADVVIHAATAIPSGARMRRRSAWALNDRIRTEGTRTLAIAAGLSGAGLLLQQSVAWVVRSRDGAPYDESTPPDPPELVRSAVEGETIARELGERHGFDVGVLRAGVFYGPEDAGTRAMADALRKRRLPVLGRGDSVVAPVHVEDVVAAFVAAVEVGRAGTWHVVDDRPLPMAEWLACFADVLGSPRPRGVPPWLGRLLLGAHVVEAMTTSMATTNTRLRRELGWEPRYPTVREGLEDAVRRWAAHGGLQPPMIPLSPAATASPR